MFKSSLRLRSFSIASASSSAAAATTGATAPSSSFSFPLSHDAVVSYRQKGYLVIDSGFFTPEQLRRYEAAVRGAAARRGPELTFPTSDGSVQDLEIHVQGKVDDPDKRQQRAPASRVNIHMRSDKSARRVAKGVQKRQRDMSGGGGVGRTLGYKEAATKDASVTPKDLNQSDATSEELERMHDEYVKSEMFQRDVVRKMRLRDITRYFEMIHKPWMHVWHGDEELARFFASWRDDDGSRGKKMQMKARGGAAAAEECYDDDSMIGRKLGRLACEASGCARVRIFSDRVQYRVAWGSAHALHCEQSFVDFNDYRAALATVVFGDVTFDRETGGFFVLDGSHHIMRKLTANSTDASVYKAAPTAWDFGEIGRKHKREFRRCQPTHLSLKPGSVLLMSSQLVWGHVPNYTNQEAFSHTVTLMPDGSLYNGMKHTWLSRDEHGPLFEYKEGEPLQDDALFPMLFSVVDTLF